MPFPRSSGILLHPTSFPSPYGIGDLGSSAYEFINFLCETRQKYWQILPLGPTGYGNSPYMSYSAMAGNPLLISPDKLKDQGWLTEEDLKEIPDFPNDRVDFDRVIPYKMGLLRKAYQRFAALDKTGSEFEKFCDESSYWLDDYALFMTFKGHFEDKPWVNWDKEIAQRYPDAIKAFRLVYEDEIEFYKFIQFELYRQWGQLRTYANERMIEIIGDIAIYVAHDSADVWSHPSIFCLDQKTLEPARMAGVPPDYFSPTGQLWGNPLYLWKKLEKDDFDWWVKRFQNILSHVDLIRIDHFLGFEVFWSVRRGETNAIKGKWVKGPSAKLFEVIKDKLGSLPIMAEDLGLINDDVKALRDRFEFPGMKILLFAFGSGPGNPYLPFNIVRNCVLYTGTHDNNTTVGWFHQINQGEKDHLERFLGSYSPDGIHWDLIRMGMMSIANQAIFPLQDILGLGGDSRMNTPGQPTGNWEWRYSASSLTGDIRYKLGMLTEMHGRCCY